VTSSTLCIDSVTFFGCACGDVGDPHFDAAYETAKVIASSGRRVVNGGGPGVMLAATVGAQEVNGKTTAVYYRPELATNFKGEVAANFADKTYEESNYILRTKKLLELGDAYIVFNGGTGTISEFAMAWGVARLYIDKHKPLILYGKFWEHLMYDFKKHMLIRPDEEKIFTIVDSPQEALKAIEKFERVLSKNPHLHNNCRGSECALFLE
jgi:predicted Rossmann-fold nucleotide-binding protein